MATEPYPAPDPVALGARPLDFLVIGAAKSGTTTLFHHLEGHPDIGMPAGKEAPFFSNEAAFCRGWPAFVADQFEGLEAKSCWGKVTPRYLGDLEVPARLHACMPDVKLVALLRNPIDRAFSKYRMLVRDGWETRPFRTVVDAQLAPDHVARSRTETLRMRDAVLARSEYARLLDGYLSFFPREQLLVELTDDFESQPGQVVRSVLAFLGVDADYEPPALGRHYHVGGQRKRLHGVSRSLGRVRALRSGWSLIPSRPRQRLQMWLSTEATVVSTPPAPLEPDVRERLAQFFADDVARLEVLIGREVPWADWRRSQVP